MADGSRFGFVQFELAFPLGPADGRYLRRASEGGEPERVVVLRTLGARERRSLLRGGKPRRLAGGDREPEPVPTVRAALVDAQPLDDASAWLDALRRDAAARDAYVAAALGELNAVLRAHRAAAADPYVREITRWQANAVRVGYGSGDEVADGRYSAAYDVTTALERTRRTDALAPQERLAALLNGSDRLRACEELVLRARLDLDAGRPREAALQARVALEALLAELPQGADLAVHRDAVGSAANAALDGDPPAELRATVAEAVDGMRRALARSASHSG